MSPETSAKTSYKAPWSWALMGISWGVTALILGLVVLAARQTFNPVIAIPLGILAVTAPFTIRGYRITPEALLVQRLFWDTCLPLAGLQSAAFDPTAMKRSIRTGANGGLFSYSGYFSNKALGDYRALVTNPALSVVLRFPAGTIVVSPEAPQTFVQTILALAKR